MANQSKIREQSEPQNPVQQQDEQPGDEHVMTPRPKVVPEGYRGTDKLKDRVALITGGDSGIGRSAAVLFAREGADVAVVYHSEDTDARETQGMIEDEGRRCLLIRGDVREDVFCQQAVEQAIGEYGKLNVLVNNAAVQFPRNTLEEVEPDQVETTFRTNIFSMFYITRHALHHLRQQRGNTIINTTSVTAYRGAPELVDYSATKGAIVSFTRSLSTQLSKEGVRVNAVAPGPVWTPLIPASFPPGKVEKFGSDVPLGRAGEPAECGPCYVFLASDDSSYITGQVLHPNGGEIVNG